MPFIRANGSWSEHHTVTAPSGSCSIVDVDGQERRRAVVLRPVELDAARDPRAREPDERRLDHVVAVEEVVARRSCRSPTWMRPPSSGSTISRSHVFSRWTASQRAGALAGLIRSWNGSG